MTRARRPKGAGAVMASRASQDLFGDDEALRNDYFPTPPWAARAGGELIADLDPAPDGHPGWTCWEPAAGGGHMAHGLADYFASVRASDLVDRGGGAGIVDFLDPLADSFDPVDWIVTNPPFKEAEAFVRVGMRRALRGVAMLCRLSFIEGEGRHALFTRDAPLTVFAPFSERVPMVKGRWDPDASTATAYAWFVWLKTCAVPLHPSVHLIAPGARKRLIRASDFERFAPGRAAGPDLFGGSDG